MLMLISEVSLKKIVQSYAKDISGVRYVWHILYITYLNVINCIFDTKTHMTKTLNRNRILLEYKNIDFTMAYPQNLNILIAFISFI